MSEVSDSRIKKAMIEHKGVVSYAAKAIPMAETTLRRRLAKIGDFGEVTKYVITNAVNNTGVHQAFWDALQLYCEANSAKLYVIPSMYKNPSAMNMNEPIWFDHKVIKYLMDERISLNEMIDVVGDIPIQPTAANPLSGLDPHADGKWCIIGHPQIQMRMVPTSMDLVPPMLHTTGSCCVKNYSASKAGKQGELHHSFGAVVVECYLGEAHVRELIADDSGTFYDLDKKYTPKGITDSEPTALVTGDEHIAVIDKKVVEATYKAANSIVQSLRPAEIYRPDVLDFFSRNHHHSDPILNFVKHLQGSDDVRQEIEEAWQFMIDTTPEFSTSYVIASNHNEAFDRWLREANPDKDPKNARIYHEMKSLLYRLAEETGNPSHNALEVYIREHFGESDKVLFLERNKAHLVNGIDVSQHGDKGANGGRGSRAAFAKTSFKSIIQHSHTPGIEKGCVQVGTSTGALDYVSGLTSWFNTHCLVQPNGKRQLLHVHKSGRWRG